jgi:cobalt-precorrin 5A hydrolase
MVGDETMSRPIAIGVGCRLGCAASAIEQAVRQALQRVPNGTPFGLFSIADKREEAGLVEAAYRLGFPVVLLPRAALRGRATDVATISPASRRRFDLPSVCEAAALAGAGSGSTLLVPRIVHGGAACAIAGSKEVPAGADQGVPRAVGDGATCAIGGPAEVPA